MIALERLSVCQGAFRFSDVEMRIPDAAYAILMGPTGCGKTTLIETICGLRPVHQGRILLNGDDITRLAPFDRNIGYVPQDSVLFPTMRVAEQIEFALSVRKIDRKTRRERVQELSDLMGISHILRRYPKKLSGGEKQRVALARALAARPRLLCLDEPLAALDDATKSQISALLKHIHKREQVPILHITHNAPEAKALGTIHFRIEDGRVVCIEIDDVI